MNKKHLIFTISLSVIVAASLWLFLEWQRKQGNAQALLDLEEQSFIPVAETVAPGVMEEMESSLELSMPQKSSFYSLLANENIDPQTILKISKAAKEHYDLRQISPGTRLVLSWNREQLNRLRIQISTTQELTVLASPEGQWQASLFEKDIQSETVAFFGSINSTLWESAIAVDMPVELIASLSEIFASQMDFSRELTVDDQWAVLVERQMVEGQPIGYGNILAAEISKHGETLTAYRFQARGRARYYDASGSSLLGKFLKSPLRYTRVSSRFQKARFHPVLKTTRQHKGVDFAAPTGTPIRSVGDGLVLEAGRKGGAGIMLKIQHDSVHATAYKHLSRIASGVRSGKRIEQGQIIGYVGQTGLATGPHLHFEFLEKGRFVDPLGKRFPTREHIAKVDKGTFIAEVQRLSQLMQELKRTAKST